MKNGRIYTHFGRIIFIMASNWQAGQGTCPNKCICSCENAYVNLFIFKSQAGLSENVLETSLNKGVEVERGLVSDIH